MRRSARALRRSGAILAVALAAVFMQVGSASAAPAAEQCTAWETMPNADTPDDSRINDGTMTVGIEKQTCNADGVYRTYIRALVHQNAEQTWEGEVDHMRVRMHRVDRRAECPTCDGLFFEVKTDQPGVDKSYFSPRFPASAFKYYQADVSLFYVDKPPYDSQAARTWAYVFLQVRPAS